METILVVVYFIAFAVIAGGAFALMTQNLRRSDALYTSRSTPPRARRHPEAPEPGEEVLIVDLSRERLEQLYQQAP